MTGMESDVIESLRRLGVLDGDNVPPMKALPGGVSSDIWRLDLPDGAVCVKRALPRLRVEMRWEAPVERNTFEWEWMRCVAAIAPDAVPPMIAHDRDARLFVMTYLDPETYPLWKHQLRDGVAEAGDAAAVGRLLGTIHSRTANRREVAEMFSTDRIFHAMRLEPYLEATARAHGDLSTVLLGLAERTAATKRVLVHGDVSPKNIMLGPKGPVFLDAECAWYGDPAFDVAFCLKHLLLKCLWTPGSTADFLDCFNSLWDGYRNEIDWEPEADVAHRVATLLPGLFLARVDGKSPVEYLTSDHDKDRVRRVARALLADPVQRPEQVCDAWRAEVLA
ncbi:MAG: aminoglycoside phosphotransferase family protein [Proteobacteria bacterium]|nr:aminoglycoside phosphotransferase family protein [Pseudomonadota bacterium]